MGRKLSKFSDSDNLLGEWHLMVKEVVGGIDKTVEKNSEFIKKEIGATVKITNDLLNK